MEWHHFEVLESEINLREAVSNSVLCGGPSDVNDGIPEGFLK